jgi:trans-aconitate methyltransferase
MIAGWNWSAKDRTIDMGAGTGNFSIATARRFPGCEVIHLDADPAMNAAATKKAQESSLKNYHILTTIYQTKIDSRGY